MLISVYAQLLGLMTGTSVNVIVPQDTPLLARCGLGRIPDLQLELCKRPRPSFAPFAVDEAVITGTDVQLGWKLPALLIAPLWMTIARPTLLFTLLLVWLRAPGFGSTLEWEGFVSSQSLNSRGVWRFMLGRVLDGIASSSLPGMLATTNLDGTQRPLAQLPRSTCTCVSVAQGKLVLDGHLESFQIATGGAAPASAALSAGAVGGPGAVVQTIEGLDYTLRMGVRLDQQGGGGEEAPRSALLWDTPELKLSLGNGFLSRLLPQLWVPVLSEGGVLLPRSIDMRRVTVSDAGDGMSAAGTFSLGARRVDRGDEPGGSLALSRTR